MIIRNPYWMIITAALQLGGTQFLKKAPAGSILISTLAH